MKPGPWTFRAMVKMTIPARWWQAFGIYGQVEVELLGKKLGGLNVCGDGSQGVLKLQDCKMKCKGVLKFDYSCVFFWGGGRY